MRQLMQMAITLPFMASWRFSNEAMSSMRFGWPAIATRSGRLIFEFLLLCGFLILGSLLKLGIELQKLGEPLRIFYWPQRQHRRLSALQVCRPKLAKTG